MTGFLEPEVLDTFKDENGTSFVEAANAAGFSAGTSKVLHDMLPAVLYIARPQSCVPVSHLFYA